MRALAKRVIVFCRRRPVYVLSLGFLFFLPFLEGGTSFSAEILILLLPLPFFLLGLTSGEIDFRRLPNRFFLSWLAFLVFVGISVFTSTSQIFSIPAFFQLLAVFLFFNLFLLMAGKESFKYAIWLIFTVSFLLCLLSFYYLLPWVEKPAEMNLVYATYGHSHLADYLLLVIPFALALFLDAKGAKKRRSELLFGGLLIFYLLSFVLTFSRGAFLVLPLVVLLLILLARPRDIKQKILSWFLVLIPIGLLVLIAIFSLSSFGVEAKLAQPEHWLVKQIVKPEFQAKRLDYWQQALEGFRTRPLFGFGWGTFEIIALRFQKDVSGWSNFTHNFYLQTLAEAGIFAFFAFLGFLFLSLRRVWQLVNKNKTNPFLLGGFGAILASSLHSFLDYDWHFPAVFLTFLFLLANLLAINSQGLKRNQPLRLVMMMGVLVVLVFVFGWMQLAGEYFYRKGDYQKALFLSPWPAVRVRQIGDKIFEKDFAQGEKIGRGILSLSSQDSSMHYWLADKYYFAGKLEKSAEYYQKAIKYNPLGNYHLYQRLGEIYEQLGKQEEKDVLYQFFAQKLEKTKTFQKENKTLAEELYLIGEEYLKGDREKETIFWWRKAVEFAPQWSYFHIELASLYISLGELNQAEEVLNNCLDFYFPKKHCQEYLERLSKGIDFESPGFWRSRIQLHTFQVEQLHTS